MAATNIRCSSAKVRNSLFEAIEQHAKEAPEAVAAFDTISSAGGDNNNPRVPAELTYSELCKGAQRLSISLAAELVESCGGIGSPVLATWMKRGNSWYLIFCASARLNVPLVALSADLPDRGVEAKRNSSIIAEHRPSLLVIDGPWVGEPLRTVEFTALWVYAVSACIAQQPLQNPDVDSTLCFCYTGGTTKASRCARVTHRMALHELDAYPKIAHLGRNDKVLQQHSLYWGASAYGEIDIALAFGCALIFCEAWDTDGVAAAIKLHGVTCAGLVPSMLAALEPTDVPNLRLVFTWGEALQARVAREWAQHVHLLDLLISTECWLSLYADWSSHVRTASATDRCGNGARNGHGQQPPFKSLHEAEVRLRPVGGTGGGELLVSGPMVSPGYTDQGLNAGAFETDKAGVRWYCTKDCLEPCGDNGFKFAGRADDLVKVGGVWVDIRELEYRVLAVEGVAEVFISARDVFVVLKDLLEGTIHTIRRTLPPDFVPYIVRELPRRTETGKVDRSCLASMVGTCPMADLAEAEAKRCIDELSSILRWYRILLLLLSSSLFRAVNNRPLENGPEYVIFSNLIMIVLGLVCRVVYDLAWRLLYLSYMVLSLWLLPHKITRLIRCFPAGTYGFVIFISAVLPDPIWGIPFVAHGMYRAIMRGRLVSWPLVALLGYPFWLRSAGIWIWDYGFRGTVRWYFNLLMYWPAKHVYHEVRWQFHLCCGRRRQCAWCKGHVLSSNGRQDPSVDKNWYCNKCWEHYAKHKQCSKCKEWSVRGKVASPSPGGSELWICNVCEPRRVTAEKSAGQVNGQRTGNNRKQIKIRTISLLQPAVTTPTNERKRQILDGDDVEMSPPLRLRTSPDMLSNKIHSTPQYSQDSDQKVQIDEKEISSRRRNGASLSPHLGPTKRSRLDDNSGSGAALPQKLETPIAEVATVRQKSKNWKIIERATGLTFDTPFESLLSLDSLHHTKLTTALRRQAGKRVSREVLKRSACLGDLLAEVDRLPDEHSSSDLLAHVQRGKQEEHAIWGMMWRSKCQWVFHRSSPLKEAVLRSALKELVERHGALRTDLRDPYSLFTATQQALTVFELFRRYGSRQLSTSALGRLVLTCVRPLSHALQRVTSWSFSRAWPRVSTQPIDSAGSLPLTVHNRVGTFERAQYEAWNAGMGFQPPFHATLVPYGRDSDEGAFLHLAISHMLSDGYCVVPLLDDIAHLVSQFEASLAEPTKAELEEPHARTSSSLANQRLPPVPSAFAALEHRIAQTVAGVSADNGSSIFGGGGGFGGDIGITREFFGPKKWHDAATTYATLPSEVLAAIRTSARFLSVPDDIAMLAAVGITLAWFEGRRKELIAMIVPQRDGPSENDMVGLFADVRHLTVATEGLNFAGVALRLHHVVKERLWCAPGIATQFDMTIVNFEWTDFEERHGFTQHVRVHEQGESSLHPLRVAVDQPHRDAWRMRVSFDKTKYNEARRSHFFDLFEKSLQGLIQNPLDPVWPAGSKNDTAGGVPRD